MLGSEWTVRGRIFQWEKAVNRNDPEYRDIKLNPIDGELPITEQKRVLNPLIN